MDPSALSAITAASYSVVSIEFSAFHKFLRGSDAVFGFVALEILAEGKF